MQHRGAMHLGDAILTGLSSSLPALSLKLQDLQARESKE
jgi:hypothetical protein